MIRLLLALLIVCVSFVLFPAPSFAHSVQTDYQLVSDALEIQSTFSTGEAVEGATVVIYAPNDPTKPWLQGKTDQNGSFQFQPDRTLVGEWSVKIGEGDHGDILSVPVTNQGVDVNAISQNPYDAPHGFARQTLAVGVLLGSSLGTSWWMRWRKRKR